MRPFMLAAAVLAALTLAACGGGDNEPGETVTPSPAARQNTTTVAPTSTKAAPSPSAAPSPTPTQATATQTETSPTPADTPTEPPATTAADTPPPATEPPATQPPPPEPTPTPTPPPPTPTPPPARPISATVTAAAIDRVWRPAYVEIATGGTVTFSWAGLHHLRIDGLINTPAEQDGSYPVRFDTPGVYTYHCDLHAGMVGTVDVR